MAPPTTSTSPRMNTMGRKLEDFPSISISAAKSSGSALGVTGCDFASSVALGSITVGIVSHLGWEGTAGREVHRQALQTVASRTSLAAWAESHAGLTAALTPPVWTLRTKTQ